MNLGVWRLSRYVNNCVSWCTRNYTLRQPASRGNWSAGESDKRRRKCFNIKINKKTIIPSKTIMMNAMLLHDIIIIHRGSSPCMMASPGAAWSSLKSSFFRYANSQRQRVESNAKMLSSLSHNTVLYLYCILFFFFF